MDYNLKVIIDGVEVLEQQETLENIEGAEFEAPSISNVKLKSSTSLGTLKIGSSASDQLSFRMLNPFKTSYDGSKVEFFVSEGDKEEEEYLLELEEEAGAVTTDESISEDEVIDNLEEEEEGEDLTPEESAEALETSAEETESFYEVLNDGIDATDVEETTQEEEAEEWTRIGVYYVFSQTLASDGSYVDIVALDGMANLNNGFFVPTIKRNTLQGFHDELKSQLYIDLGVVMDDIEIPENMNIVFTWNQNTTYREAIEYISGLLGGYATFGDDDTLGISYFTYDELVILKDKLISYVENSADAKKITAVRCVIDEDTTLTSGEGAGITFSNPFMTQAQLDEILTQFNAIELTGGRMVTSWNYGITSGQFARVMTSDEYINYIQLRNALEIEADPEEKLNLKDQLNSIGVLMHVTNQTIDFTGDAASVIDSICEAETTEDNTPQSPTDAKFRRLKADLIEADSILAQKIVTSALQSDRAEIKQLVADNIDVNSINGNVIKNSQVLAKALSKEMLETYLGVKVFYQAIEPTAENVGDIWYVTLSDNPLEDDIIKVWNGTEWVATEFDTPTSIFKANSIVAHDLNAENITTNEAFMDKLQTNLVRVGDRADSYINLDGDSIDFHRVENGTDKLKVKIGEEVDFINSYSKTSITAGGLVVKRMRGDKTIDRSIFKVIKGDDTQRYTESYVFDTPQLYGQEVAVELQSPIKYITTLHLRLTNGVRGGVVVGRDVYVNADDSHISYRTDGNILYINYHTPYELTTYIDEIVEVAYVGNAVNEIVIGDNETEIKCRGQITSTNAITQPNADIIVDTFTKNNQTINASDTSAYNFDVTKEGYTPLGVVGFSVTGDASTYMIVSRCYINSANNVYMALRNTTSTRRTNLSLTIHVLYQKTS